MAKPGKNEMMPGAATPKHVRSTEYEGLPRPEATAKSHGTLCRKQVPRLRLVIVNPETGGEVIEEITTVGIDLAKDVFAICVLDARGAVVERKVLRRAAFERWAESLSEPCTLTLA